MTTYKGLARVCVLLIAACEPTPAIAAETTVYDTVHIRVTDTAKAIEWYMRFLGATAGETSSEVLFRGTHVQFLKTDDPSPSAGSVIDHIGFSYANVNEAIKAFEAGGVKIVSPPRDYPKLSRAAFIEDPWGVKIEIVEDPALLGFHHVHLRVQNPEASLTWFQQNFVVERTKFMGQLDGLRLGNGWLFVMNSGKDTPVRSTGRAIENIALRVQNVDSSAVAFKGKGIRLLTEPSPYKELRYAYIEDPTGVKVGLIERPHR